MPLLFSAVAATKPLRWFHLGLAFVVMALATARDVLTTRQRLSLWTWMAAAVAFAFGIGMAVKANRQIMDIVRWQRVLIRGLLLLSAGINVVPSFIALDSVVDMLVLRGDSSAAASCACAVVVAAVHLRLGWVFIVGE